jgi:16S rRNA (guanine527-N7)-methyltransferase
MEETPENLELICKYFNDFTPEQLRQLSALEELYLDWNSKINVISRKDIGSLYEKHVLHSLSIATLAEFPEGTEIIDIGTGGGFPGIPLAIFFPEVRFHLIDSIGKKIKVVQEVAAGLGLKNVTAQHTRVEDIRNRKYDYAVSRAVAPLKDLWKWSKPLLRKQALPVKSAEDPGAGLNGFHNERLAPGLICLKGGDLRDEIQESGTKPKIMEVFDIFPEEYFREKYVIHVKL